jgi:hypothetical protein
MLSSSARMMCGLLALLAVAGAASAQTLTDHVMMKKKQLLVGGLYTYDRWDKYWEGGRKRSNGNIGTLTTQIGTLYADYGVSDRMNVIVGVPHVETEASQGTTRGQEDWQDITVGVKYNVSKHDIKWGKLRTFAVVSGGTPLTNYTPDLLPLSIGLQTDWVTGRGTVNLMRPDGWFVTGSAGYSVRGDVELDREFYFTNGRAVLSNTLEMEDVVDYSLSTGLQRNEFYVPLMLWHQNTLGGGDIRRQDQPYSSNDMDFTRIGLAVVYLPSGKLLKNMMFRVEGDYVLTGRNVGQSETFTAGVLRSIQF